jgi:hypothetical protein
MAHDRPNRIGIESKIQSKFLGGMACAISGACLGIEAIPQAWQEKLENHRTVADLALQLVALISMRLLLSQVTIGHRSTRIRRICTDAS